MNRLKRWERKKITITCEHVSLIDGKIEPGHHMEPIYYGDSRIGEVIFNIHHCVQCCERLHEVIAIKTGLTELNPEFTRCTPIVAAEREARRKHCEACKFCADLAIQAGQDYERIMEAGLINDEHRRASA